MENWKIQQTVDLNADPDSSKWLDALMLVNDNNAHTWEVTVKRGSSFASLTGGSVAGYFRRKDDVTVMVPGTVEGNIARVTLPQACYACQGNLIGIIRLTMDDNVITLAMRSFWVASVVTDKIADPDNIIPSLADLLAQIKTMEQVAASATAATDAAGAAADAANAAAAYAQSMAGIHVKGLYTDLAALQAAHPTGVAGDHYAVGTESSNVVYIWDVDAEEWISVGSIKGYTPQRGVDYWTGADRQEILEEVDETIQGHGYLTEESDPTVPSWAKQPTKPSYTASEVSALPSTFAAAQRVTGAAAGDFAGLNANGDLTDSGKKASDFVAANKVQITTYYSVTQLGKTAGSAIINDVFSAMVANSILICQISDLAASEVPVASGLVEIIRGPASARSACFFWGKEAVHCTYRKYMLSDGSGFTADWYKMYDASNDSGWIVPTLLNGWTEVTNYPVRYCVDALGFVHFKGKVINTTTQNSGYILSIPDAYKPQESCSFATLKGNAFMKLTTSSWDTGVGLDGVNVEANTPVSLEPICYRKKG